MIIVSRKQKYILPNKNWLFDHNKLIKLNLQQISLLNLNFLNLSIEPFCNMPESFNKFRYIWLTKCIQELNM